MFATFLSQVIVHGESSLTTATITVSMLCNMDASSILKLSSIEAPAEPGPSLRVSLWL